MASDELTVSPTGSGQDAAAIQQALAAVGEGGTVVLESGDYGLEGPLSMKSGQRLVGQNRATILTVSDTNVSHAIVIGDNAPVLEDGYGKPEVASFSEVSNLMIRGQGEDRSGAAIVLRNCENCVVRNVYVEQWVGPKPTVFVTSDQREAFLDLVDNAEDRDKLERLFRYYFSRDSDKTLLRVPPRSAVDVSDASFDLASELISGVPPAGGSTLPPDAKVEGLAQKRLSELGDDFASAIRLEEGSFSNLIENCRVKNCNAAIAFSGNKTESKLRPNSNTVLNLYVSGSCNTAFFLRHCTDNCFLSCVVDGYFTFALAEFVNAAHCTIAQTRVEDPHRRLPGVTWHVTFDQTSINNNLAGNQFVTPQGRSSDASLGLFDGEIGRLFIDRPEGCATAVQGTSVSVTALKYESRRTDAGGPIFQQAGQTARFSWAPPERWDGSPLLVELCYTVGHPPRGDRLARLEVNVRSNTGGQGSLESVESRLIRDLPGPPPEGRPEGAVRMEGFRLSDSGGFSDYSATNCFGFEITAKELGHLTSVALTGVRVVCRVASCEFETPTVNDW